MPRFSFAHSGQLAFSNLFTISLCMRTPQRRASHA